MMGAVDDQTGRGGGWAVPGSAGADGGGPTDLLAPLPGPVDAAPGPARPVAAGRTVPRVELRPMTLADILDGGFGVLKARPRRILGVTAAFVIPAQLLVGWSRQGFGGASLGDILISDPLATDDATIGGGQILASIGGALLNMLALVLVAAAIAHLVSQWTMGRDAPAGEMVRSVGGRFWALLGSFLVVKLAEFGSVFACYIGLLFVMPLFVVVAPAIAVERIGGVEGLGRSVRLARSRYWAVMGIAVVMGLVATLLATALSALPQLLAAWIGFEHGWPLLVLGGIIAQVVVIPFVAAATVLLYFDLRVRSEGLDIEMTAIDVLDRRARVA
jgi:hypothetical protein